MKFGFAGLAAAIMAFAGCEHRPPQRPPAPTPSPHYVLGEPYQAGGVWYYPAEDYAFDQTGIAAIDRPHDGLTADGEAVDPTALTASMQTVQLPAIAEITNLENGYVLTVRVNDRGPADPARVIALSPRAAALLRVPEGGARVRVRLDTERSHRLVDQVGGGPRLSIRTAARETVQAEALPAPGAAGRGGGTTLMGPASRPVTGDAVPDRLPETLRATLAAPGRLWLRCGVFGRFDYANVRAARLGGLGGHVLRSREGREETYAVRAGPFATIPQADAALRRALGAGVPDARISVEP